MTADELAEWAPRSVAGFAAQQADSGLLPLADARERARRMLPSLLPDGVATPGHRLLAVRLDGRTSGHVWLRTDGRDAHLVDLELDESVRGRGLGTATLRAAEDLARAAGARVLSLNVFARSTAALALYDRAGYAVTGRTVVVGVQPTRASRVLLRDLTAPELDDLRPRTAAPVDRLLPGGPDTPGHRLWTAYDARDPASPLGCAWLQLHDRSDGLHAGVVHAEVAAARRGHGHGHGLAAAVLAACHGLGVRSVTLTADTDPAADAVLARLPHRTVAQQRARSLAPAPGRGMPGERAPGR